MLEVRHYPDPVLLRPSQPVVDFDQRLRRLIEDMYETMYTESGVGLAAPQVGVNRRLFVLNCDYERSGVQGEITMVNPVITHAEERYVAEEGCLSFPGIYASVERYRKVRVRYQDATGAWQEREAEDLCGRAVQHELDHLEGKVFVDRLAPDQKAKIRKQLDALKKDFKKHLIV